MRGNAKELVTFSCISAQRYRLPLVGQAGIEPTVSGVITRMGDHTLLSHMAAGSPASGLCLLSAEIRIERKKRQWLIAVEVGAGIEPTASCCAASVLPQAPTDHLRAGLVFPGTPQLPASFALAPQGGLEPHYVTGSLPYLSRFRAHAIGPRHIYACRLSGCQASLPSALPPRSDPAGVS